LNQEETIMKLKTIALAGVLALTSTFALAQSGGANSGAAVSEKSGTATNPQGGAVGNSAMQPGTTGMGSGSMPSASGASAQGAPTASGVNSKGSMTEPGAVKNGTNGR
jgi:hypothetical protein